MKKISVSMIALLSASVFAQQIQEIKADNKAINEGDLVRLEIALTGQGRCGIQVNFGDGSTNDLRVEDASKSVFVSKNYSVKGTYKVEATGKTLIRGLNSFIPCKGAQQIEISVGRLENPISTQSTPAPVSANIPTFVQAVPNSSNSGEFTYQSLCGQRGYERKPCIQSWTLKDLSLEIDKLVEKYKGKQGDRIAYIGLSAEPIWEKLEQIATTATLPKARGLVLNFMGVYDSGPYSLINFYKAASLNDVFGKSNYIIFQYSQNLEKSEINLFEKETGVKLFKLTTEDTIKQLESLLQQIDSLEPDQVRANRARKITLDRLSELKQIRVAEQAAEIKRSETAKANTENAKNAANKGIEFAREAGDSWKLYEKKDELSGSTITFARSIVKLDNGEATTDIYCSSKNILSFEITTKNILMPIKLNNKGQRYLEGRQANNEKVFVSFYPASDKYNNVLLGKIFYKSSLDSFFGTEHDLLFVNVQQSANDPSTIGIYRMIFELPTNKSPLIIKIPSLASSIKKLMQSC